MGPAGSDSQFFADQFLNPLGSDWPISNVAPLSPDSIDNSLLVRRFDDTVEEGVGFPIFLRDATTNLTLRLYYRAQSPGGGSASINLRVGQIPAAGGVFSGYSAPFTVGLGTPATTEWSVATFPPLNLASFGVTPGSATQWVLSRNGGTLVGDLVLYGLSATQGS